MNRKWHHPPASIIPVPSNFVDLSLFTSQSTPAHDPSSRKARGRASRAILSSLTRGTIKPLIVTARRGTTSHCLPVLRLSRTLSRAKAEFSPSVWRKRRERNWSEPALATHISCRAFYISLASGVTPLFKAQSPAGLWLPRYMCRRSMCLSVHPPILTRLSFLGAKERGHVFDAQTAAHGAFYVG